MTFSISLTGLSAAQTELTALSNNIANVSTVGFKRSRVEFGDIVTRSVTQAPRQVTGVGTAVSAVKQQFDQGPYQQSSNALDLSIGGAGFFLVKGGGSKADSLALSRNGSFSVDADRWVIDNQGRRLQVLPTTNDGVTLAVGIPSLQALRLPETSGVPVPTTAITLAANLPSTAVAPTVPFSPSDPASYNAAASETIYASDGTAQLVTFYYRFDHADPVTGDKYWDANVYVDGSPLDPASGPGPLPLTFDSAGNLTSPAGPEAFVGGLTIDHSNSTSYAQPFTVPYHSQNGYSPGRLESIEVDLDGVVWAGFSNGERNALGKVAVGDVPNQQGLKQNGDATWLVSGLSGPLRVGEAGQAGLGAISSSSLERSNVDLTEELVGLISAQRNFQANARAIDTASSLLQTIIQLRN